MIYSSFVLNHPKKTIAFELADRIDNGNNDSLKHWKEQWKFEALEDDIYHIYGLERYHLGKNNRQISNRGRLKITSLASGISTTEEVYR